jgi:hypothetical protein
MKKFILFSALLCSTTQILSQQKWFSLYNDSTLLVNDAKKITTSFENDIKEISPALKYSIKTVLNTTPYLIYYDNRNKTANLPLWEQVIPEVKNFFYEVAGGEEEGRKAFGLFFNGFYLPHELGHAFQEATSDSAVAPSYQDEYLANTMAILWWRKHKKNTELDECYTYAKKIWSKLPNPVPANMNDAAYFTKNYEQASSNPYTYGYMQFKQFINIYEDKSLPDFDTFIKNQISK